MYKRQDDKGNFKFSTVQKLPFTLVISSVGYAAKEIAIKDNNQDVVVELETAFTLGDEIVAVSYTHLDVYKRQL